MSKTQLRAGAINHNQLITNNSNTSLLRTSPSSNVETIALVLDLNPAYDTYYDTAGTIPCTNGQTLARWLDKSNTSSHFSQILPGDRPNWYSSGLNGKPYVKFPGFECMYSDSSTILMQPDLTIYIVTKLNSSPNVFDVLLCRSDSYNFTNGWATYTSTAAQHYAQILNSSYGISRVGDLNLSLRSHRFKTSAAPKYNKGRYNNSADSVGATPSGSINTPVKQTVVGGSWNVGGDGFTANVKMDLYRLLIYSTYHDDATYLDTLTKLNAIYNIY